MHREGKVRFCSPFWNLSFLSVCIYVFLFLETVDSIDGAGGWL